MEGKGESVEGESGEGWGGVAAGSLDTGFGKEMIELC